MDDYLHSQLPPPDQAAFNADLDLVSADALYHNDVVQPIQWPWAFAIDSTETNFEGAMKRYAGMRKATLKRRLPVLDDIVRAQDGTKKGRDDIFA